VLDLGLKRVEDPVPLLRFYEAVGRLCLLNNQPRDAIICFTRIRKKMPENLGIGELLVRAYVAAGERRKAIATVKALARNQPDTWQTYYFLGELAEDTDDPEHAAEYFLKASRMPPPQPAPFLRLAFLQLKTDPARALATLQEALKVLPEAPGIRTYLGLVYSHLGRYAEALQQFKDAEQLFAKSGEKDENLMPLFYFWYGSTCEQAGQSEEAEQLLEKCIALCPDMHEALNYLAYMWADRGVKLDKALDYISKALALAPKAGAYVDTLGWIRYKRREYQEAVQQMRQACELLPDDPTINDHMGDVWHTLKQDGEAVKYWTRSFRLAPSNAKVADKLRRMGVDIDRLRPAGKAASDKRPK
jgi:tetratricopeptide (TPR) repeat protein